VENTAVPEAERAAGQLITGTVVLAALIRGLSAVLTGFLVWPLLGMVVTALYGTRGFVFGVAMDLLLSGAGLFAGLYIGFRARRDAEGWHRGIRRFGWFLGLDVLLYLLSVLVALIAFGGGKLGAQAWGIAAYIVLGNAVLLWLALKIIRYGRALTPPPVEQD
jgi:hypothetical protein